MNRRQFIRGVAAGAAFAATGGFRYTDASPLRVGLIGSGWYGKIDLLRLIQVAPVEVVSLCDVDTRMLAGAAEIVASRQASHKRPRTYTDYREMLAERDLDVVLVGTPDHWHALPTIAAIQSGAHVWVQKPISVDIVEGQAMVAAARKYNRVVQVGTQRRSTPHLIEARDRFIREGLLGDIGHIEIYCYWPMRTRARPEPVAPPDYLDYEMWTGPAPMLPFYAMKHPRGWRSFMEYSNGVVGDMAIHMLDMVRWMLDLGWPRRVSSMGGILVDTNSISNVTDTQTAVFDFGDLEMVWTHRTWGNPPDPDYPWGATIYGSKGTLKLSVWSYDFIPTGDGNPVHGDVVLETDRYPEDENEPGIELFAAPAIRYQMLDFLHAIETGTRPVADIEQGHISTASCILANLALQTGESLNWDPVTHRITNHEEANNLLERPYRQPWAHPGPDAV